MGKRRDNGTLKKVALVLAAIIVLFVIYYLTGDNQPNRLKAHKTKQALADRQTCSEGPIEQISWTPRVFIHRNFLSKAECEYIMSKAEPLLSRSQVVGANEDQVSNVRTSYGTFIGTDADPILMKIEQRIAEWTMYPVENGESFYVLRYEPGQQYVPHHDFFTGEGAERYIAGAGNRAVTVVIYLHEPEEGGETTFPMGNPPVSLAPKQGDAVLFHNMLPSGDLDEKSLHGGSPVVKGTKWVVTKWIRTGAYPYSWWYEFLQAQRKQKNNGNQVNF